MMKVRNLGRKSLEEVIDEAGFARLQPYKRRRVNLLPKPAKE